MMRAIRSGELADRAFARQVAAVAPEERAWLHELVYGTLRLRGRLDYIIARFTKPGITTLDDDVLDILRLAAYQLREMRSVPAYAAVSQAVELTKQARLRSAAGFVNGVLQSMLRSTDVPEPAALGEWQSHPQWILQRWCARFGKEATRKLCDLNNTRPEVYVRKLKPALPAVAHGGEQLDRLPDTWRVEQGAIGEMLAGLPGIVQDPAAGFVTRYAAPAGGVIADLCAAPGGKALALSDAVAERGMVIATDISAARLKRAIENRQRLGFGNVHFAVADARSPVVSEVDMVLLDAPCTGTGTFRRHPDGKWRLQPDDLRLLVNLQAEMLDAASSIVRVGGVLVYSTCSIEPEENQEQIVAFLERHPNYLRRPPSDWDWPELIDEVGNLELLPHISGFDGAFAARLERVS